MGIFLHRLIKRTFWFIALQLLIEYRSSVKENNRVVTKLSTYMSTIVCKWIPKECVLYGTKFLQWGPENENSEEKIIWSHLYTCVIPIRVAISQRLINNRFIMCYLKVRRKTIRKRLTQDITGIAQCKTCCCTYKLYENSSFKMFMGWWSCNY